MKRTDSKKIAKPSLLVPSVWLIIVVWWGPQHIRFCWYFLSPISPRACLANEREENWVFSSFSQGKLDDEPHNVNFPAHFPFILHWKWSEENANQHKFSLFLIFSNKQTREKEKKNWQTNSKKSNCPPFSGNQTVPKRDESQTYKHEGRATESSSSWLQSHVVYICALSWSWWACSLLYPQPAATSIQASTHSHFF